MSKIYFEDINTASNDYPFLDLIRKNINYISHYHNEIEIIYIVYGSAKITVNENENDLKSSDIYIVMPGEIHSYTSVCENNVYIMKLVTPKELFGKKIKGKISKKDIYYQNFKNIIDSIALEDTKREKGYKFCVNSEVYKLFALIIRYLDCVPISEKERNSSQKKVHFLNLVNQFINLNYAEKIRLDNICNYCGYSKYYFVHSFKEITGMRFIDYLAIFRLEKAISYFPSDMSITEIAMQCGFCNLRAFNRSFKKYYNTTPSNYRSRN